MEKKIVEKIVDEYFTFLSRCKADETNYNEPFIYEKKGNLVIELDNLNSLNVKEERVLILELLNDLKEQNKLNIM